MGYLTFESLDGDFTLSVDEKGWGGILEYSTDTVTWTTWTGSIINSLDNKLYLRGTGNDYLTCKGDVNSAHPFILSGTNIMCSGNIANLLDYQTVDMGSLPILETATFRSLFENCTALIIPPEMPFTDYSRAPFVCACMFDGCTNLLIPPNLYVTGSIDTLPFMGMFGGCTNLKFSTEKTAEYCLEWSLSSTITSAYNGWNDIGLGTTSGPFTGNPEPGVIYYISDPFHKRGTLKLSKIAEIYPRTSADMVEGLEDMVSTIKMKTWTAEDMA